MKYFLNIFFLFFYVSVLSAQEKHFVFIQSDNNQLFYLSINGKLYSSTATGYVIIPKLTDGDYNFSIGFAQNAFPEQNFQCAVNKKDLGFNLKNFGEKGWGLFNLQSLSVTMAAGTAGNDVAKAISETTISKESDEPVISFSKKKKAEIAADAQTKTIADASVNEQVAKNERSKDEETKPDNTITGSKESNNISNDAETTAESNEKTNNSAVESVTTDRVKKVSEITGSDGVHLAYVEGDNKTDTINIIIPSNRSVPDTEKNTSSFQTDISESNETFLNKRAASENDKAKRDSAKFLDLNMDVSKKDIKPGRTEQDRNMTAVTNSRCKNVATDEDYARLRRKMAMGTNDEKMINEAKKIYRNKCFTTRQIKSLSTLFLSDEGRYNFFNASYNSVTDLSEYYLLQSEFIDPAYVNRFKALLQ